MHTRKFSRQTEDVTCAGGAGLVGRQSDSDPNARRHMSDIPGNHSLVTHLVVVGRQSAVLGVTCGNVLPFTRLHLLLQPSESLDVADLGTVVGLSVDYDSNSGVRLTVTGFVEVPRATHSRHGCANAPEPRLGYMMLELSGAVVVREQAAARAIALQHSFDDEEACNRQNDQQDDLPEGQISAFTFSIHSSSDMCKAA
jgi:hypothetical protein